MNYPSEISLLLCGLVPIAIVCVVLWLIADTEDDCPDISDLQGGDNDGE